MIKNLFTALGFCLLGATVVTALSAVAFYLVNVLF